LEKGCVYFFVVVAVFNKGSFCDKQGFD